jgi:hypothetical protein
MSSPDADRREVRVIGDPHHRRVDQHVGARLQREHRHPLVAVLLPHAGHLERVGHHDAVETELLAQQPGEDRVGQGGGTAGQVERRHDDVSGHHHIGARSDGGPERRQVDPVPIRTGVADDRQSTARAALSTPRKDVLVWTASGSVVSADSPYTRVVNSWPTFSSSVIRRSVEFTQPVSAAEAGGAVAAMARGAFSATAVAAVASAARIARRLTDVRETACSALQLWNQNRLTKAEAQRAEKLGNFGESLTVDHRRAYDQLMTSICPGTRARRSVRKAVRPRDGLPHYR